MIFHKGSYDKDQTIHPLGVPVLIAQRFLQQGIEGGAAFK